MSRIVTHPRALLAMAALVSVAACAKPPQEAIDMAMQAQTAASAAGADQYAPESMNAVLEAKAALDAELAAQSEKMSLTRSYDHAEELVAAYKAAADQAASQAAAAKEQAKQEAATLITDGRLALDEVTTILASAPRGKGSAADLAALKTDLESAGMTLVEAEAALTSEMYLDARAKAASAREVIDRVKAAVAGAQAVVR